MAFSGERVLSIQSHVVFGYVGGKAAVFPLQCLGYDVDVVNTVHFSNHSGYARRGGTKTSADELNAMFGVLESNEMLMPTRLLTGYIPGAESLSAIADLVRKLKKERPNLIYLLDPVLGDAGRLYVAEDVIPVYRKILPLATVITPNWFEAETLTQVELKDHESLKRALQILHEEYHVPNVVISSIPYKPWLSAIRPPSINSSPSTPSLLCVSSTAHPSALPTVHTQLVPLIPGNFSGVGDFFSSLLLAHLDIKTPCADDETPISRAASWALTKTHAVLRLTHEYSKTLPEEDRQATDDEEDAKEPLRRIRRMRGRELRLVQNQDIIRGVEPQELRKMELWKGFWDA